MAKGITFNPTEDNRKFLEEIQKEYKKKGKFKGFSVILNSLITEERLRRIRNPFN